VNTGVAAIAFYSRRYERAMDLCRQALEIAPDDIEAHCILGLLREVQGEFGGAVEAFTRAQELSAGNPLVLGALASAQLRAGERSDAMQTIASMRNAEAAGYVPPIAWAWVYLALGDADEAVVHLNRAADAHDAMLCYIAVAPSYDSIRRYPVIAGLLQRIGMSDVDLSEILAVESSSESARS
jgi:Flp pilus assembly protein TadD